MRVYLFFYFHLMKLINTRNRSYNGVAQDQVVDVKKEQVAEYKEAGFVEYTGSDVDTGEQDKLEAEAQAKIEADKVEADRVAKETADKLEAEAQAKQAAKK